jgi:hypothetical protein
MAISSDDPDSPAQLGQAYGNPLYSPGMGLAAGLLQAAGPSRLPVSLGQALSQGMQTAQQWAVQDAENKLQRYRFAMALQQMQKQNPMQPPQPQTQLTYLSGH